MDVGGLLDPAVRLFGYRRDGELLALGALKLITRDHAEIKSMRTVDAARGRGIGRTMLVHLIDIARTEGIERVSLETGTAPDFHAAHAL